ncbi:MAG TPA: YdcF family protein [Hyphomicrobiaceae bacterium]|nr:YdcF family protein [Hyphomicrobiaceae bacterium]
MMRLIFTLLSLAVVGLAGGFIVFAVCATSAQEPQVQKADAIVVVTGGEDRISAALGLLRHGSGRRLLISGVNPRTSAAAIRDQTGEERQLFECCVDIGREASDTIGNAEEARDWAGTHGYRSLIVVTSAYHMPRTLAEFARAMPHIALVAHPVSPRHARDRPWWQHPGSLRLLASEYLKYIAAITRLAWARTQAVLGDTAARASVAG